MKKFYIPTSIVYTNRSPHIGFALELIQADVLSRYHRVLGEEVFFLTGTDEHGIKNAEAAKEVGKTAQDWTGEMARKVKNLTRLLNLSNNDFIRTSDKKRHWPTVKKVWQQLKENRDIYKKRYKGLYCVGCEAFVQKKDLIEAKCPLHQKEPEIIEEENYFFRLSKYQNQLRKIIATGKIRVVPEKRRNELLSFIKRGLEDTSCSRSKEKLAWGIPVPDDETQTIYVWLEALVNYLSAVDYAADGDKFKKFWPPDVHCIGKDIFIRFHGSLWPAMLLSLGLALPKAIFVHGFITVAGQKMSKSLGNVIDPFELVKKYGTDSVRYFLLREISPTEDGDFTYQKFEQRYNADLASGLGNLVARVMTMAEPLMSNVKCQMFHSDPVGILSTRIPLGSYGIPEGRDPRGTKPNVKCQRLVNEEIKETKKSYKQSLEEFKFNEALTVIWRLIGFYDRYIEETKLWENTKKKLAIINDLLFALTNIAQMLQPFLPETSEKLLKQLKLGKKGKPLFPRLNP